MSYLLCYLDSMFSTNANSNLTKVTETRKSGWQLIHKWATIMRNRRCSRWHLISLKTHCLSFSLLLASLYASLVEETKTQGKDVSERKVQLRELGSIPSDLYPFFLLPTHINFQNLLSNISHHIDKWHCNEIIEWSLWCVRAQFH